MPSLERRGKMGSVERGVYVGKRDCKGEVLSREREGHFQMSQCVQGRAGSWVCLSAEVEKRRDEAGI